MSEGGCMYVWCTWKERESVKGGRDGERERSEIKGREKGVRMRKREWGSVGESRSERESGYNVYVKEVFWVECSNATVSIG